MYVLQFYGVTNMRKPRSHNFKIHDFKIRKVQDRKGSPWVLLPKDIFTKGDTVIVSMFDSDTALITKRLPGRKD